MKHLHLRAIAKIRMGYTFRGSLKDAASGNTAIIQMKDASEEGILQTDAFARTQIDNFPEHYLLCPGDLIFRSRGLNTTTILIEQTMEQTICIAPLMFIRVLPNQLVLPAYLHWFINLATTQQKMNAYARGTTIRMISAESMEGLEVVLPTLDKQQKIIAAAELNRQIVLTQTQLAEKRQRYTEEALLQYAKGLHDLDRS
jgi:hypothetical protein